MSLQSNCLLLVAACTALWSSSMLAQCRPAYGLAASRQQLPAHWAPACPRGFSREPLQSRRCYKLLLLRASWVNAKAYCEAMDASLAEVASPEEHQFLADQIARLLQWLPTAKSQRHQFWLGATDLAQEGHWRWLVNYRPLGNYSNWGSRQPDMRHQHEHCLAMKVTAKNSSDYRWHDVNCNRHNFIACSKLLDA